MSIADDLTRIQGAKEDLRTSIQAKGVTVPASAKIDAYPDYVDAIQQGGGGSNLTTLNVTPTTSAQHLTPTSPVDGWDEVNVSAVTSAIDSNITAGNIKSGVNILGVTGTYTGGSATIASTTATVGTSNASSISFTLSGQPKMWAVILQLASSGSYLTNSSTSVYAITSVISDGTNRYAICSRYNSSGTRAAREYYYTNYTASYNNGTLTITATTGVFYANNTYRIIYAY